jgi:hypothetical protein
MIKPIKARWVRRDKNDYAKSLNDIVTILDFTHDGESAICICDLNIIKIYINELQIVYK